MKMTKKSSSIPVFQVDAFTEEPFGGNPAAVCLVDAFLPEETMRKIAMEMNLSETTFVLPSEGGGDVRVRIFTPVLELPFAGHPTIGSCRAWLNHGGEPRSAGTVVQECGIGLVELRHRDEQLAFAIGIAASFGIWLSRSRKTTFSYFRPRCAS